MQYQMLTMARGRLGPRGSSTPRVSISAAPPSGVPRSPPGAPDGQLHRARGTGQRRHPLHGRHRRARRARHRQARARRPTRASPGGARQRGFDFGALHGLPTGRASQPLLLLAYTVRDPHDCAPSRGRPRLCGGRSRRLPPPRRLEPGALWLPRYLAYWLPLPAAPSPTSRTATPRGPREGGFKPRPASPRSAARRAQPRARRPATGARARLGRAPAAPIGAPAVSGADADRRTRLPPARQHRPSSPACPPCCSAAESSASILVVCVFLPFLHAHLRRISCGLLDLSQVLRPGWSRSAGPGGFIGRSRSRILIALQDDGRQTNARLAEALGLSQSAMSSACAGWSATA